MSAITSDNKLHVLLLEDMEENATLMMNQLKIKLRNAVEVHWVKTEDAARDALFGKGLEGQKFEFAAALLDNNLDYDEAGKPVGAAGRNRGITIYADLIKTKNQVEAFMCSSDPFELLKPAFQAAYGNNAPGLDRDRCLSKAFTDEQIGRLALALARHVWNKDLVHAIAREDEDKILEIFKIPQFSIPQFTEQFPVEYESLHKLGEILHLRKSFKRAIHNKDENEIKRILKEPNFSIIKFKEKFPGEFELLNSSRSK